jgi:hypothetical protein
MIHAIVNHHMGNAKLRLDLCEDARDGLRVSKVPTDEYLIRSAVLFLYTSSCECNFVALCCEGTANVVSDVGTGAKNESDRGTSRHVEVDEYE